MQQNTNFYLVNFHFISFSTIVPVQCFKLGPFSSSKHCEDMVSIFFNIILVFWICCINILFRKDISQVLVFVQLLSWNSSIASKGRTQNFFQWGFHSFVQGGSWAPMPPQISPKFSRYLFAKSSIGEPNTRYDFRPVSDRNC